jgi:hypothetical protein
MHPAFHYCVIARTLSEVEGDVAISFEPGDCHGPLGLAMTEMTPVSPKSCGISPNSSPTSCVSTNSAQNLWYYAETGA